MTPTLIPPHGSVTGWVQVRRASIDFVGSAMEGAGDGAGRLAMPLVRETKTVPLLDPGYNLLSPTSGKPLAVNQVSQETVTGWPVIAHAAQQDHPGRRLSCLLRVSPPSLLLLSASSLPGP